MFYGLVTQCREISYEVDEPVKWISHNWVVLAGLMVSLCLSGCSQLPPDARQRLLSSDELYRSGRYPEARQQLSDLIRQHADKAEIGEAYYLRGLCGIQMKDRTAGRGDLERAVETTNREDVRGRALATLGIMAYEDGDFELAVDHLQEAVKLLPSQPPVDELLLRLGSCLQRVGQWKESRLVLARVLHEFGSRPASKEARRKYGWPYEYFAIQAGAFRSTENARKLTAKLKSAGLAATYRLDARSGKGLHVVTVGRYIKWVQAERELARVRRVEPAAIIVP